VFFGGSSQLIATQGMEYFNGAYNAIVIFLWMGAFSNQGSVIRPDVAEAYGKPELREAGFKYSFPLSSLPDLGNFEVRIFSVSKRGTASELIYPSGYKWGKKE